MSEIEGIPTSSLLMFVNDHTIDPYDTPQSINLTVADTVGKSYAMFYMHSVYEKLQDHESQSGPGCEFNLREPRFCYGGHNEVSQDVGKSNQLPLFFYYA